MIINIDKRGIGLIQLGKSLSGIDYIKPLGKKLGTQLIDVGDNMEGYKYFYVPDNVHLENVGVIDKVIAVTEPISNNVIAIYVWLNSVDEKLDNYLRKIFGTPRLSSSSGVENVKTNNKIYWPLENGFFVFRTAYYYDAVKEISMYYSIKDHIPPLVFSNGIDVL